MTRPPGYYDVGDSVETDSIYKCVRCGTEKFWKQGEVFEGCTVCENKDTWWQLRATYYLRKLCDLRDLKLDRYRELLFRLPRNYWDLLNVVLEPQNNRGLSYNERLLDYAEEKIKTYLDPEESLDARDIYWINLDITERLELIGLVAESLGFFD